MTWRQALEIEVERTGFAGFRERCAESHPDHQAWRRAMLERVASRAEYPSLARQARSALAAAGRVVAAVVNGEPIMVPDAVLAERRAICMACEFHDVQQNRCTKCGCGGLKLELATERCPIGKWERVISLPVGLP